MKKKQLILIYIIVFIILSFLLKFLGLINFSSGEIFGYAFIFYGLTLVYTSMGKNKPGVLFSGSSLFLTGVFLFIINNFQLVNHFKIIVSAVILGLGINFLILYIDAAARKIFLLISVLFIIAGVLFTVSSGSISLNSFFDSLLYISSKYWPILIILAGIIFITRRDEMQ